MFTINVSDYQLEFMLCAAIVSFLISYLSYETIITVAEQKHLMDEPGERSSHHKKVPTLGGIAIYLSLLVVLMLLGSFLNTKLMLMSLASLSVLLFLGLKDDLLILASRKKFFIQVLTGIIFIAVTDLRITSLFGVLGFTSLTYLHSFLFSLFVFVLIINAYNMIDGIDGLAGGFGVIGTLVFSGLLYSENQLGLAVIGISAASALIAFLRLNLSQNKKIFMGDTGTMIVGFCLAILTLGFLNTSDLDIHSNYHESAPVLAIAILFFPLLDTLRVFVLRVFKYKKSPFSADRNHIHHWFLDLNLSHIKVSSILIGLNLAVIAVSFLVNFKDWTHRLWGVAISGSIMYFVAYIILKTMRTKKND
ncbi:undecaprenyl/decaprenyl-phosphate alpha-N-acetylglucosaminyl 1-phosphate transferase [Winogradskyella sp.]|nr:undecaprenyl/decaprenyl-phosphate alpha-N-acetylglucosaminyl 1-phosphate transferase [Winogradskyella sp.]